MDNAHMRERTRGEIDALKADWDRDGFGEWDLELTHGFGAHYDELKAHVEAKHVAVRAEMAAEEAKRDAEATRVGLRRMYRIILDLQRQVAELDERLLVLDGPMSTARN